MSTRNPRGSDVRNIRDILEDILDELKKISRNTARIPWFLNYAYRNERGMEVILKLLIKIKLTDGQEITDYQTE